MTGALVGAEEVAAAISTWTPAPEHTGAVIAAAGRGTRLGYHLPKVLYPIEGRPLVAWLTDRLAGLAGRLTLVLSPDGDRAFRQLAPALALPVCTTIQPAPTGMADAVIAGTSAAMADGAPTMLIVIWGDQVGLSRDTMARALAVHARHPLGSAVTVPLAQVDAPYVHYDFDRTGAQQWRLLAVRQRREGDVLPDTGLADCGCFIVDPGRVLPALRRLSASGVLTGRLSREENFLQALPFLAREMPVLGVPGAPASDTIGLNAAADLDRLSRATGLGPPTDR